MRASRVAPLLIALAACAPRGGIVTGASGTGSAYDVVIENGRVVDGTGATWFYGDVALRGDRIAAIGPRGAFALTRDTTAFDGLPVPSAAVDWDGIDGVDASYDGLYNSLLVNYMNSCAWRQTDGAKLTGRELEVLGRDIGRLEAIKAPFPRMSYDEAVDILRQQGVPFEWGGDFGGTDETVLSKRFDRPVLVHRFPSAIKAFYMKPDPGRPELALGVDFLAPEGYGEVIGGGERLADLDLLLQRIQEHQLPQAAFEWYLDLRRYGTVPHAGFGMGVERTVAWICGLEHIRETVPYPRMLYRMYP